MKLKLRSDALLEDFRQYEIQNLEKSQIRAGTAILNGCSQNGGASYVDYYLVDNSTQYCNIPVSSSDESGWCANMTFQ